MNDIKAIRRTFKNQLGASVWRQRRSALYPYRRSNWVVYFHKKDTAQEKDIFDVIAEFGKYPFGAVEVVFYDSKERHGEQIRKLWEKLGPYADIIDYNTPGPINAELPVPEYVQLKSGLVVRVP